MEVKYRNYIVRIDYIDSDDNAPEWANMEVEYDDYQDNLIFIRSKEEPSYDDILVEVQDRISFDIEREVEFFGLEVEYEIIGVSEAREEY